MFLIAKDGIFKSHHQVHAQPQAGDWLFVFQDSKIGLTPLKEIPRFEKLGIGNKEYYSFGRINQHNCFLWPEPITDLEFFDARYSFRVIAQKDMFQAIAYGHHVYHWRYTHQYCGLCGNKMQDKVDERALECSKCQHVSYPKISPCVIVLITHGEKMLLARSPHFMPNMMSALAGFVEIGEALEQTLVREVKEEVGIQVKNLRYVASQPWPFPDSLMLGFMAEYDNGELTIDNVEIEQAAWFDKDNLPQLPHELSISRHLIEMHLQKLKDR